MVNLSAILTKTKFANYHIMKLFFTDFRKIFVHMIFSSLLLQKIGLINNNIKKDDDIVLSQKYPRVQKESNNNIIMIYVGCGRYIIIILLLALFLYTWILLLHNAKLSSTFC